MNNPYKNLQDYQFWRRGVSNIEAHAIDPVVSPKFSIGRDEKVATAGSCFAQHISRQIKNIGFNYYVPESGDHLDQSEQSRLGYGVFSARFGNIYTVRQLLQLFEEAFGQLGKSEIVWQRDDGRLVDAFRPGVEPDGYGTVEEVLAARATHLRFVKQLFLQSDIFVFTLGLTESWSNRSGEVFPLAPGVAGGSYDENNYSFKNLAVNDVIADLRSFLNGFKEVNPKVRVLLTVSPVPLIATYEKKHVLVATTYSKSVLRVAAETVTSEFDWVDYFPSYEIITGNFSGGRYYEDDLREIGGMGVNHAMRCFLGNYVAGADKVLNPRNSDVTGDSEGNGQTAVPRLGDLMCDEELIERVSR